MGIEEDRVELTGSDYERKLYDLKKGHVIHPYLVQESAGRWDSHGTRPGPGQAYIERMPDGSCRKWNNQSEDDRTYTPI